MTPNTPAKGTAPAPLQHTHPTAPFEQTPAVDPEAGPSLTLQDVWVILRRRALVVLLVAVAVFAATWYAVREGEQMFRASASVRIDDVSKTLPGGILEGSRFGSGTDPLVSQIQMLRSRSVLGAVVDRTGLQLRAVAPQGLQDLFHDVSVGPEATLDSMFLRFTPTGYSISAHRGSDIRAVYGVPVEVGGVRFSIPRKPSVPEATAVLESRYDAVNRLNSRLDAGVRPGTNIIDITYSGPSPTFVQEVVNATIATFQEYDTKQAQQQSGEQRRYIAEQLSSTDSALTVAQQQLAQFRQRENVFNLKDKLSGSLTNATGIEFSREDLISNKRMYGELLDALAKANTSDQASRLDVLISAPGLLQNPVVSQYYADLVKYQSEKQSRTGGTTGAAPTHPDIMRLDSLISITRGRLVLAVRSLMGSIDSRIRDMDLRQQNTTADVRRLSELEAEDQRLSQRVETIRGMADQLRLENQRLRIAAVGLKGQVEIIDPAVSATPVKNTGRPVKLVMGAFFGLILGSAVAFVIENMNTTIRRREDLEQIVRAPVLGVIPRLTSGPRRLLSAGLSKRGKVSKRRELVAAGTNIDLIAAFQLRSSAAESFRTLRTNLMFSRPDGSLRRLAVTSAMPGEGKTTVASNLAIAFAQQGLNVLLLEADLRRPRMHRVFGLPLEPGLTNCIVGRCAINEAIRLTSIENLSVITCGAAPPNPSELLGSESMRKVLAALDEQFDLLVIDTPPVLAAADAAVVGSTVDAVLVVVRGGKTNKAIVRQAVQQLHTVGAPVIGTVLNDMDAEMDRHYGYEYSQYADQYYGSESDVAELQER